MAVAETAVDIAPIIAEFEDAIAVIVTGPDAPCTHRAIPFWSMVAILELETIQLPENGSMKVTGAGEGGWLKTPVAVNCTWPLAKFWASAVAGERVMDIKTLFCEFIPPHAVIVSTSNMI